MLTKNKIYIIITIFIIINAFLIVFVIPSILKEIKKISLDILSSKDQLSFIEKEKREFGVFQDNYKNYEPTFRKIDQLFIDANNPLGFIEFLEASANDHDIDLDINLIQKVQQEVLEGISFTPFQISTKGVFSGTLEFLEKLEKGPYLLSIQNLKMEKLNESAVDGENILKRVKSEFLIKVANK